MRKDRVAGKYKVLRFYCLLVCFALANALALPVIATEPVVQPQYIIEGDNSPFKIFMILWRGWTHVEEGFRDYLAQHRIAAELIVRNCDRRPAHLPSFIAEAKALQPDLVYTWGTTVSLDVLGALDDTDPEKHITQIPAIFVVVSFPVGSKLIADFDSSGRNFTGTRYLVPLEAQLKTMATYSSFDKMAVIFNPLERNSQFAIAELTQKTAELGMELITKPVPLDDNRAPIADAIPSLVAEVAKQQPGYLYIPPDSFLNVNRHALTEAALDHGIPTFAAAERPVRESSAMMGLVSRYYSIGQLTGYRAEQILVQGIAPKAIAIESLKRFALIINMRAVLALGSYPPMNLLRVAEVLPAK